MKNLLLKFGSWFLVFKPFLKMILKKKKEKLVKIINKKYDNKNMTEKEEAEAIGDIIQNIINLI